MVATDQTGASKIVSVVNSVNSPNQNRCPPPIRCVTAFKFSKRRGLTVTVTMRKTLGIVAVKVGRHLALETQRTHAAAIEFQKEVCFAAWGVDDEIAVRNHGYGTAIASPCTRIHAVIFGLEFRLTTLDKDRISNVLTGQRDSDAYLVYCQCMFEKLSFEVATWGKITYCPFSELYTQEFKAIAVNQVKNGTKLITGLHRQEFAS